MKTIWTLLAWLFALLLDLTVWVLVIVAGGFMLGLLGHAIIDVFAVGWGIVT